MQPEKIKAEYKTGEVNFVNLTSLKLCHQKGLFIIRKEVLVDEEEITSSTETEDTPHMRLRDDTAMKVPYISKIKT